MPLLLLIPIGVIAFLYRADLGAKGLLAYGAILACGALAVLVFGVPPMAFHVMQCLLAIAMLIHVRANPPIPKR